MLTWNNHTTKRFIRRALGVISAAGIVYSCASVGRPEGGPLDETPPKFLESTPAPGALNNTRTKISLEFDEFIKIENANEKVVISPPQVQMPEIKANGKRVTVNLLDTLKANTTYTIDFADAIVDNNEGNPLGEFGFTFSTGNVIDTMVVSGTLLNAADLEPVKGMVVGLHANLEDSAFSKLPLERVGRTDSRGRFSIRGVAPGRYHIFGLKDADQNFIFSQKTEAIAFEDSLIIPRFERRMRQDTVWKDSITVDSIVEREYTHYLPDNVYLRGFIEEPTAQYMGRSERPVPYRFTLKFGARADTLPTVKGLNFDERDAFIIEKNDRNDSINYWIKDSLIYQKDTLALSVSYLYTDSLENLVPKTDTLKLIMRRSRQREEPKKKKKGDEEETAPPTVFLAMKPQVSSSMDVYGFISLEFEEPIAHYDTTLIHLRKKVDSLYVDVPYDFEQDATDIKKFNVYVVGEWESKGDYEFSLDSIAFTGLYGLHTDKFKQSFKVKSAEEDYGAIFFNIKGLDSPAFVELLDASDKVLRRVNVKDEQADFYYLNPGKYCARLICDRNNNGKWDTGNYAGKRQPEEVYYYWQILETKVRTEFEQDWDIHDRPLDKQKPDDLKKQKPDEDKKKKQTNTRNTSSANQR